MAQISIPLGIKSLEIKAQSIDSKGSIVIDVVSLGTHSTCHKCQKPATMPMEQLLRGRLDTYQF